MRIFDQAIGYPFSGKRQGVALMLHVGRCGSTVLANLLNQHPDIYWDAKLHRKARELYGNEILNLDYGVWTKRQFSISGARFYGFEFKILFDQYPAILGTTTQAFLETCKDIGVTHYILLKRSNTLRHVVSHYASRHRGNWHVSNSKQVQPHQFGIDIDSVTTGSSPGRKLEDYLQQVDDTHSEVRAILEGEGILEIEYESDIDAAGAENAYRKVCKYFDIAPVEVKIKNRRVNPFNLVDTVLNYRDIEDRLRGTKFEWMLESES